MGALLLWSERESNQLNAGVRWTPACRRLDGGNTLIFATGENANRLPYPSLLKGYPLWGAFYYGKKGSRTNQMQVSGGHLLDDYSLL